jgi:hypothetical protein
VLHEITLDLLEFSILVSSGAVIYPEPVEARDYLASLLVGINNPAVKLHNLNEEIHIVWGRGPLSSNQKLGGGLGTRGTINALLVSGWYQFLKSTTLLNWRMLATIASLNLPLARSLWPELRRILIGLVDLP